MPRGGARKDAGRKPKLTDWEQFTIGAECESRWQETYRLKEKAEIAGARVNVAKEWAKAKDVPLPQRKQWIDSEAGREHLDNVEFALRENQGLLPDDPRDPARVSRIVVKRPKGPSAEIIREMAKRESEKRKTHISKDMIERCWTYFRKMQSRLDET